MKFKLYYSAFALATLMLANTSRADEDDAPAYEGPVSVAVAVKKIRQRDIGENIKVFGELAPDPDQILSISLPRAGLINRIWVRIGQRVNRGDQLLEIVTAPDARMQYLQAQSGIEFAQKDLQHKAQLYQEQLITKAELEAAEKSLQDAKSTLHAMQERGLNKASAILNSPLDGIITQIDVSQGQRVAADTAAMLLANRHRLIARMGVEPELLSRVKVGLPITLQSVFEPDIKVESQLREVHAMINPSTNLVDLYAEIPEKNSDQLILGSHMVGIIHLPRHPAMLAPRSAILHDENGSYLFTILAGKAKRIAVEAGIEIGDWQEVSGAIHAGDVVVSTGNYELADGDLVREILK